MIPLGLAVLGLLCTPFLPAGLTGVLLRGLVLMPLAWWGMRQ